jgi:general secretion pathway protein F
MTVYQFRAVTTDDCPQVGQIDAGSAQDVAKALLDRGLYPLEITASSRSLAAILRTPLGGQRMSMADAAQVLGDLGHLARAGVEVADALAIMAATASRKAVGTHLSRTLAAVRRGASLSEALAEAGSVFPPHILAVIRAGELTGTIAVGLQHAASDLQRAITLRKQVQTALIYPACIAIAAFGAITVLLVVVVPTLQTLIDDATRRLPWQTRLLIELSNTLRTHGIAIVLLGAMSMGAGLSCLRNEGIRASLEQLLLKAPIVGLLIAAAETARVARLLYVLTAARLPLVVAIELIGNSTRLILSRQAFTTAALKLREGISLSQSLSDAPALSPRLLGLISIGEATGRLPELLEEAARGAEQTVTTAIERFLALLTPAMTVFFGALAGFVLYAVMTAILSVNDIAAMGH